MEMTSLRLSAALAAALTVACGGSSSNGKGTTPDEPPRPATVLDSLPPGTAMAFRVDVQHLVRSKLWAQFAAPRLAEGETGQKLAFLKSECDFDPVADLSEVTLGVPESGNEDDIVVLVRGRFDAAKIERCVAALAKAENETAPTLTTTGKITEVKHESEVAYFGWVAPDTLVISGRAADDGDRTALAWMDGQERASASTQVVELWGRLKPDQLLAGAGVLTGPIGASIQMEGQPTPEAFWMNIAHHTGLKIEVGARFATADEAKASSDKLNAQVAEVAQQPPLAKYLERLTVEARDRELVAVWELSEAEIDQLIQELGPMLPMIMGGMSESP